mgnify:CR=1 FL=1
MHGVKEDAHCYPQKTGHHDTLLLAFESYPVMMAILSELGEAAAQFSPVSRVRFVLFFFVQTLLQFGYDTSKRLVNKEWVGRTLL